MGNTKKIILALLMLLPTYVSTMAASGETKIRENELQKLAIALMATKQLYVDSVDGSKLVEDAIRG